MSGTIVANGATEHLSAEALVEQNLKAKDGRQTDSRRRRKDQGKEPMEQQEKGTTSRKAEGSLMEKAQAWEKDMGRGKEAP